MKEGVQSTLMVCYSFGSFIWVFELNNFIGWTTLNNHL